MKTVYIKLNKSGYVFDLVEYDPERSDYKEYQIDDFPQDVMNRCYQINEENKFVLDEDKKKEYDILSQLQLEFGYTPNVNSYEGLIQLKIRKKYSLQQELSLNRQRETKPEEFAEYFDYCEQCKKEAKEELN